MVWCSGNLQSNEQIWPISLKQAGNIRDTGANCAHANSGSSDAN